MVTAAPLSPPSPEQLAREYAEKDWFPGDSERGFLAGHRSRDAEVAALREQIVAMFNELAELRQRLVDADDRIAAAVAAEREACAKICDEEGRWHNRATMCAALIRARAPSEPQEQKR